MLYQKEKASGGKVAKDKKGASNAQDAAPTNDSTESGKVERTHHNTEGAKEKVEGGPQTAPQAPKTQHRKPVKAKGADQPPEGAAAQTKVTVGGAGKHTNKQPSGSHSKNRGADNRQNQTNTPSHTHDEESHSTQHSKEPKRKPTTEAEGGEKKKQKREGNAGGKKGGHKKESATGTKDAAIPSGSGMHGCTIVALFRT